MRYKTIILTGLLSLFTLPLHGGSYAPSEWDFYCRKCHIERPVNNLYDSSIKAHSNVSRSCVSCHRDKGIAGHVKRSQEGFLSLFQDVTLPPDVRFQQTSSVTSDECLTCHPYILDVDETEKRRLAKEVRRIKLRPAHGKHWDYRAFTPEQQQKLKALTAKKAKSLLSKDEQDQLDRLAQIEKMQCSRCHERFRKDSPGGVDPNVNIAMKNPMECTTCHLVLRTAVHPGEASTLPSAVSCERCHYGKLHQKMRFFPVDFGTDTECLKCHPGYSPAELAAAKPAQFSHKSTEFQNTGPAKKAAETQIINPNSYGRIEETNRLSGSIAAPNSGK
jgi:hypothetical protein